MIAVSDLRIGNWVYDGKHTQFPMFIVVLSDAYVYLDFYGREGDMWESSPDDVKGIPLTEELLEKMGFSYNGVWWRKQDAGYAVDVIDIAYVQIEKWANGSMLSRCTCRGLRFVHELQNLFRDITKQELEVML